MIKIKEANKIIDIINSWSWVARYHEIYRDFNHKRGVNKLKIKQLKTKFDDIGVSGVRIWLKIGLNGQALSDLM